MAGLSSLLGADYVHLSALPAIYDLPAGWKKDVDARHRRQVYAVCARQTATAGHADQRIMQFISPLLKSLLIALPAISFLASAEPAYADLKLCNRMSYVVEAAIGIDDKAATATRGWFRIDPAACRVVVQGTLTADRILLNARALGVYGSSPIPQNGGDTLCIAPDNFVIAAARQCRAGQTPAPFTQITPTQDRRRQPGRLSRRGQRI